MKTMSSREFNQLIGEAQRAAKKAPVFITNRGKPAFVLINHHEYERLTGKGTKALDVLLNLDCPDVSDIELDMPTRAAAQRQPIGLGD